MRVKVAIVDSGISPAQAAAPVACVRIVPDGTGARREAAVADAIGHGTAVAAIVLAQAPLAQLASAQAFNEARQTGAECVAEAIRWCLEQDARVINLSLGLRADHAALRGACRTALAAGAIVVAASPARGASVYPAAYPGVLAVCGDARCTAHNWSIVEPDRLYGTSTLAGDGVTPGGASYAAARLSAFAAAFLAARPGGVAADFLQWLRQGAAFLGREQHRAVELA